MIPDNDEPGRRYAVQAGTALTALGITVRVLELLGVPEKGDVSDWLEAGGTADDLKGFVEQAPTFEAWQGTDAVMPVIDIRKSTLLTSSVLGLFGFRWEQLPG